MKIRAMVGAGTLSSRHRLNKYFFLSFFLGIVAADGFGFAPVIPVGEIVRAL